MKSVCQFARRVGSLIAISVSLAQSFAQNVPLDFSTAGYASNERPIPNAPVRVIVSPAKGDSTKRIQAAIDYVSGLPPSIDGLRGTVLLLAGRHEVQGSLRITNSGVVLRGQGVSETTLVAAGQDRRTLIRIAGQTIADSATNRQIAITDKFVPVGATQIQVTDTSGISPKSFIRITRPSTTNWIAQLRANEMGGGVGGGWKPGSRDITWDRVAKSVEGNRITIDAPLTTALEEPGAYISPISPVGPISQIGVENLTLESTFAITNSKDENHSWCAITMENATDSWVRQVTFKHFAGPAVALFETTQRITVQDCLSLAPVSEIGGYRRHTFFTMGQQTLFLRCYAEHGRHDFSVGHCAAGPNAFVQCEAREALDDSGPIESWASGVLYDNVNIDGNALTLGYRAGNNAGIGWAAANSVLWNCSASVIRCWNPPGATNWSFGSWASFEGDGVWKSSNDFMKPDSLFAEQLKARLGSDAASRLQLMPRPHEESSNPPVDKAQELAAAAHQPPPQLKDYILAAGQRDPIPSEPSNAKRVEEIIPDSSRRKEAQRSNQQLTITNGWLTIDGKLLVGDTMELTWWRGNIRPDEAASFGPALTRFVPGRDGLGFTDDLNELANTMQSRGAAALDHHYGLWYDRRRDDHERVRRIDGDVLPPFFEQPFARSGQGEAWLGLSKYDLTKFNPWYWSRLREFANLAQQRGLVLLHENYFQHNIIEAGAHWADSPWRSANNINNAGFPEPPPYAGDKRIFQAELFYDVNHPVRRKLHEGYIRQCLDNFKTNSNVIQFTSAEYSGPLHFVEFWLDTIGKWEQQNKRSRPIIALAAPKDVQDAILADKKRSAVVDVIAFRYWWQMDNGLYAPPGGKNLAPRQWQRLIKSSPPSDLNLATMAAEYRGRFPTKPVIAASEQGLRLDRCGWAYLCAGGSMPNLPRTTDTNLLAAIPRMKPWAEASKKERWVLREASNQMLIYGGGEMDLSGEAGTFRVNVVNTRTGEVTRGETVKAGDKVTLPNATVVWLTKRN